MVTVRRSASKSRKGCRTCKIRHIKCDEARPRCQRCTSTGRVCDSYGEGSPISPANSSPVVSAVALRIPANRPLEDIQQRRSFDYFRTTTVPSISGFFGSPAWNLVLQLCPTEPAISQAVIALGSLHEKLSVSAESHAFRALETTFPMRQHSRALSELRKYLSATKEVSLNVILACALIHGSVEVIQNNYSNSLVHLDNALHLLRLSNEAIPESAADASGFQLCATGPIDSDLERAFIRLDILASTFQAMRSPAMANRMAQSAIPPIIQSINQAKDSLDRIMGQLYGFVRGTAEEYKYRRNDEIPMEATVEAEQITRAFDIWNDRFEKFLTRSTSRFSRQEQVVIDVLIINHRINRIEAATCVLLDTMAFDQYDKEFDEIVTLAANVISRRHASSSDVFDFSLDIGVIQPLHLTATKCREPWIRQRAITLLQSITFQEGVWDAAAQCSISRVAIAMEERFVDQSSQHRERPAEFARVHSVGTDIIDPLNRTAEVVLMRKLHGLDGPWHEHHEWCYW